MIKYFSRRKSVMSFKRWTAFFSIMACLFISGHVWAQDMRSAGKDMDAFPDRVAGAAKPTEIDSSDTTESIPDGGIPAAQDSDLMKRMARLEEQLKALKSAFDGRVKNGHANSKLSLHGRIHFDHWAFPDNDPGVDVIEGQNPQDRLAFRRVRFGVKGDITDKTYFRITIEYANPNKVEYRDIFIGMNGVPFFQKLQIGNQKRPYSLDQLNSSNAIVFIERPFIADATQQDTRRLGIQSWNVSSNQSWNWRYGVFNRENTQNDGRYISDHYQLEVAGRLANTVYYDENTDGRNYAHWAIAGSYGHPDEDGDPAANTARLRARPEARASSRWLETGAVAGAQGVYLLGLEGVFNRGPFQLAGESMQVWMKRDPQATTLFWGAYGYAAYFLTGEHIPWDRKVGTLGKMKPNHNTASGSGWGALQVGVRYSYADFNNKDILGGVGHSMTFGLNWWWNPNTRIQFNYIHGQIDDRAVGLAGPTSGSYDILGTRLMVFF